MAKKQTRSTAAKVAPKTESAVIENPVIEQPVVKKTTVKKDSWEIKDRTYYLKNNKSPLSYMIKSANIYYFDEEKGYERELKYCQNQKTCFVDEMKGDQRLEHIIFRNGALFVPRNKQTLQKLLSVYHPLKDKLYYEWQPIKVAEDEIEILELEADAITAARNIDVDMAEAIMRVEIGSEVSKMSSK